MIDVGSACVPVMRTADATAKAAAARALAADWAGGRLALGFAVPPPDRPDRPERPLLLPAGRMPKRGRAGSDRTRFALLHAVAHIELNAIDLACDIVARFGARCPRGFTDDWVRVAGEEGLHFQLVARRLTELGGAYGDLPAHDGLWEAAASTAHDLVARLAIVPQVLEARGLDVTPAMIDRLKAFGDETSATVLSRIYTDEIGHVACGNRWFRWACESHSLSPESAFHSAVKHYFRGQLKPPFNDLARSQAGMEAGFYHGLAKP